MVIPTWNEVKDFFENLMPEDGEEMDEMGTLGVNFGAGAAALFGEGAQYLGDTTIDELRNGGLTGSAIYAATNVSVACSNSGAAGCGGSYDVTDTWNFATGTIRTVMSNGSADLDYSGNGTLDTNISLWNGCHHRLQRLRAARQQHRDTGPGRTHARLCACVSRIRPERLVAGL